MSTYELDDTMVRAWLEGHPDSNFSGSLREQLPKAPVEEPTGDVVAFIGGEHWFQDPDTDGQWVGSYDRTHATWQELLINASRAPEVALYRRVPYPTPAPSPAEAVEAAEAPRLCKSVCPRFPNPMCLREAGHSGDHEACDKNGNEWMDWPELSPVQVEAERCATCYPCVANCLVHGHPAPAEDDPIEALAVEQANHAYYWADEWDVEAWLKHHRAFATRVLEVGGQQPGVPAFDREAVEDAIREALEDLAVASITASDGPLPPENVVGHIAGFVRVALLPEEPTS